MSNLTQIAPQDYRISALRFTCGGLARWPASKFYECEASRQAKEINILNQKKGG